MLDRVLRVPDELAPRDGEAAVLSMVAVRDSRSWAVRLWVAVDRADRSCAHKLEAVERTSARARRRLEGRRL